MEKKVPIQNKFMLTVEEAIEYFNIGGSRLRQLAREWPNEEFYLKNGNRLLFKRQKTEEFLNRMDEI